MNKDADIVQFIKKPGCTGHSGCTNAGRVLSQLLNPTAEGQRTEGGCHRLEKSSLISYNIEAILVVRRLGKSDSLL